MNAEAEKLPVVMRPNGKPYQPEYIRAKFWDNEDSGEAGVIVLGTHDIEAARSVAVEWCKYWHGAEYAVKPETGWWRLGYGGHGREQCWQHDPVRGAAGVMFEASGDPEENR